MAKGRRGKRQHLQNINNNAGLVGNQVELIVQPYNLGLK